MSKFFQPSDQVHVSQRHRIANGAEVVEAPLTQAQREAIAAWAKPAPEQRQGFRVVCCRAKAGQ